MHNTSIPHQPIDGMIEMNRDGSMRVYFNGGWILYGNGDMQDVQAFEGLEVVDNVTVASVSSLTKNGLYRSTSQLTKNVLWFSLHDSGRTLIGIHDVKTIQEYTACSDEELLMFTLKYGEDFL